jgi:hypothetical protein
MTRLIFAALLSTTASLAAAADPLWLAKELTPEMMGDGPSFSAKWKMLSANRYRLLGRAAREDVPAGTRVPVRYRLLDLTTLGIVDMEIPFQEFPREQLATLGIARLEGAELLHHDGNVTTMQVDQMAGWKRVATWLVQYDHRSRRFSRLLKLADVVPDGYLHPLGYDPTDAHWYFAYAVRAEGAELSDGPVRLELARVKLESVEIDWRLTLEPPRRARRLNIDSARFSPDGSRLALVEYDDRAGERKHPARPPAQVYVIDVATRRVDTYPIPLSAYGAAFTPDSRFLLIGSHETGTVLRIDVVERRQTHSVQATKTIHELHVPPAGGYFLVVNNYELSPRKVVDVRSTEDLRLITSVPIDELFPGCSKGSPGFDRTMDGRYLFAGSCRQARPKGASGLWVLRPPEQIAPPATGSEAAARLARGETLAHGQAYGKRSGIELSEHPMGQFRSAALSEKGNAFIAGVREPSAVIAKVGPSGKRLWERVLPDKRFKEQAGGVLAPTADDGCVAYFLSYRNPAADPSARLVRLDRNGKVLWDLNFAGDGAPNSPYANDGLELQPDGSVVLKGIVRVSRGVEQPWTAVVSAEGRLVSSQPPVAPP